jgi:hypothetical protein
MSRLGVFTIAGEPYDLDDLTLDEMEQIEENAGGVSFGEMQFGSAKVMKALAFTLMLRTNPALVMADVGKVKVLDFMPPDEEMPDVGPPAEAADGNGSEPAAAGTLPSAVSTVG